MMVYFPEQARILTVMRVYSLVMLHQLQTASAVCLQSAGMLHVLALKREVSWRRSRCLRVLRVEKEMKSL